jgi:hypothetical protein
MNRRSIVSLVLESLFAAVLAMPMAAVAQDVGTKDKAALEKVHPAKPPYSPYADRNFPTRPFFGDTHLHTSFSLDAGAFGTRLHPRDAYRFARGEQVTASSGQPVRLSRPLDFLVVADHSDQMGFFSDLFAGKPEILASPKGREWYEQIQSGKGLEAALDVITRVSQGTFPKELLYAPGSRAYHDAWQQTIDAAEEFNDPGRFTAFIGYEWTAMERGNNLHRNVIYRDNGDKATQMDPYTMIPPYGSSDPVNLWKWMTAYEQKTGGSVLAIAHNGNLSNGEMFPMVEAFGKPIDRIYAQERIKWERLYETTQMKGDGESHPFLSPNDELTSAELWDKGNMDASAVKTKEMLEFEYSRSALKNGLALEAKLGVNPYKFGLVGSTDSHTGLVTVEEENFFGKTTPTEPSAHRLSGSFMSNPKNGVKVMDWEIVSSGYAAVWAQENTRESIWDAMQRRETYATTGSRMAVRFFGGWDFSANDANNRMPAKVGYTKGVPMGGDLSNAPTGKAPTFLVAALKDPIGANLDRIQIVKGWLDKSGKVQERIYDVAVSDGRKIGPDGRCKTPVGNTVDVANATWTNTIGQAEFISVWKDPEFDPSLKAFYYVRVIEIPTPRWTAYDAKYYDLKPGPEVRMVTTERAYTSPIWYTP